MVARHAAWCLTEVVVRIGGPLVLREFLLELEKGARSSLVIRPDSVRVRLRQLGLL